VEKIITRISIAESGADLPYSMRFKLQEQSSQMNVDRLISPTIASVIKNNGEYDG